MNQKTAKPKLAVFKFASCDGCQLTLLNCEDALLPLADEIEIVHFLEASSAVSPGPYDVTLVEGSITTPHDAQRIQEIRKQSKKLISIGACATAGGIQALRNFKNVDDFITVVYAQPDYIDTLATATAISEHVRVDFELRGCPIDQKQLIEVLTALLQGRRPDIPSHSLCVDCKQHGLVCVTVAQGTACLGPVTHAGCGVLCPACERGCYGCFGPMETPNTRALRTTWARRGMTDAEISQAFKGINANAPAFRKEHDAPKR